MAEPDRLRPLLLRDEVQGAQLVEVGMSGTGTSLKQFPNISSGWSGAGVTTSASITVVAQ